MRIIIQTLTRYKVSTILNIVGLSIAFAAFIILAMQIRYDFTYDKHQAKYESIHQLTIASDNDAKHMQTHFSRPLIEAIEQKLPEIDKITIVGTFRRNRFNISGDDNISGIQDVKTCFGAITDIFTFDFIEGDPKSLDSPGNFIVSERFAKKYFKGESPVGRHINFSGDEGTITAVFKTLPENGTLSSDVFTNIGDENINSQRNWNYYVYFTISPNSNREDFDTKINKLLSKLFDPKSDVKRSIVSVPLADVRYEISKENPSLIYIMIAIALLIITLAFINFVNFTIAMVPIKIKAINLRKVVGASQTQLRANVICEALSLVIISLALSVVLVQMFKSSPFNSIVSNTAFGDNYVVYIITAIVAVFAGFIAGLYPAFYSTSFQPALVLKSSYALGTKGTLMRKLLIGFQFFVAISFIAGAILIGQQHSYMLDKDRGYSKENIIHVSHGGTFTKHNTLREELLQNNYIKDITFTGFELGKDGGIMTWTRDYSKGQYTISVAPVAHNFFDFFDIDMIEGRKFNENDENCEDGLYIMSKLSMDKFEFQPTELITGHTNNKTEIVGVCENIHLLSIKEQQSAFAFYIYGKEPWMSHPNAYIKISEDAPDNVFETITEAYKKVDPTAIIQANYFTERDEFFYQEDNNTKKMMQGFSLVAIAIALVGVFGLVAFDTRFRRKEIGIRRVHGATIKQIILMFGLSYIGIIIISFALSVPLVYYGITIWLESFPYKIEIAWWVFALALLLVVLLTLAISITQSYKAANENPVKSLKDN